MALYLGNQKIKLHLNGSMRKLNISSITPIINDNLLLSSDDYILQDLNGIYLIPNDSLATTVKLLLSDGRILKESNGLSLVYKEAK